MSDVLHVQHRFAQPVGVAALRNAHLEHQLLQPDASGERREAVSQAFGLVGGQGPRRADVEDQPIGQRALTRRVAGEFGAHRSEGEQPDPLEAGVGQLARHRVWRGAEITNFGQCEQPMIARVRPRDALEQVHVFG